MMNTSKEGTTLMIKFISYLYYKIDPQETTGTMAIKFTFIVVAYLLPLMTIIDEFYQLNIIGLSDRFFQYDNPLVRRLLYIPLVLPIYIVVYILLYKNKSDILEQFHIFKIAKKEEIRKMNLLLLLYSIVSFFFILIGLFSTLWVPIIRGV